MKIGIDYIGTSAGAVIKNAEGKYFLAKRGSGARDDVGTWEFPGGTIEFYETREDAAKRNVKRKYDFEIKIVQLLGVYEVIDKVNGDHWISTTFLCEYEGGEPKIMQSEKCSDWGWFTLREIEKLNLNRISKLNLKDLKLKLG